MTRPLPDQAKESWDLSNEEKVELARKRKERGNALFKASKWAQAVKKYKSAAEAVGYDVRRSLCVIRSCDSNRRSLKRQADDTEDLGSHGVTTASRRPGAGMMPSLHEGCPDILGLQPIYRQTQCYWQ